MVDSSAETVGTVPRNSVPERNGAQINSSKSQYKLNFCLIPTKKTEHVDFRRSECSPARILHKFVYSEIFMFILCTTTPHKWINSRNVVFLESQWIKVNLFIISIWWIYWIVIMIWSNSELCAKKIKKTKIRRSLNRSGTYLSLARVLQAWFLCFSVGRREPEH